MQNWNIAQEAVRAGYSLGVSLVTLLLGWWIGHKLTFHWNIRQKRRELQLSAAQQFYAAYGEFFAVWKLWDQLSSEPSALDKQWELHKRAAAAESIIEGTLVRLSGEVLLDEASLATLGRFRQGFQQLRESIRDGRPLNWWSSEHAHYSAFKVLTTHLAVLLVADWPEKLPSPKTAADQLRRITSNDWETIWWEGIV